MSEFTQFPVAFATKAEILAAGIALPIVSIVIGVLRFATRHVQQRSYSVDDWFIIPALVFSPRGVYMDLAYQPTVLHYWNGTMLYRR